MAGSPRLRGRARLFAALVLFSAAFAAKARAIFPIPRYGQAAALMTDGRILVVGGSDQPNTPLASVEILDTTHGSEFAQTPAVSAATSLTFARSSATVSVLPNGNVLVTGGWDGATARSDAEVYDPLTNLWAVVGGMSSGRFNHTATLLDTGKVLVCGGQTGAAAAVTATCDLFTPSGTGGSFAPTGSLLLGRALHTSTLLVDGSVWVAGGWTPAGGNTYVVTTERYSPVTGQWSQSSPLNVERAYHTATLTGDNKVLVAGGYNQRDVAEMDTVPAGYGHSQGVLNSTELFDPIGGSIVPGPPLQARIQTHAATLRPEGTVSAFGGIGNILSTLDNQVITFDNGAVINDSGGGSGTALFAKTGANATIKLGTPVSGTIIDGDIEFSNPILTFPNTDLSVTFAPSDKNSEATGVRLSLNGAQVGCASSSDCGYINGDFPFLNMGQNTFTPTLPYATTNKVATAVTGYMIFTPTPAYSTSTVTLNAASTFTAHLALTVPAYLKGQQLTNFTLTLGGLTNTTSWVEKSSYTVTVTGGSATGPGAGTTSGPYTVLSAGGGVFYIDVASVTFTGLAGTVQVLGVSPYDITSPMNVPLAGPAQLGTLNAAMTFTTHAVDLCEDQSSGPPLCSTLGPAPGTNDYVVIRNMLFGDNEYFVPSTNQWAFQPPGFTVVRPGIAITGASALVTTEGDEFDIAGRTYSVITNTFNPHTGAADKVSRLDAGSLWDPSKTADGTNSDTLVHAFHTATLLPNGTVLLAGGTDGSYILQTAETFDPAAGTFSMTASPMTAVREHHSASLLPNGRVLLAGGFSTSAVSTGPVNSAELYYPNTRVFLPAAVMISSRSQHVAVSLPNGNVFVAGGFNGLTTVTNTAEIYQSTTNAWVPAASMPAGQERAVAAAVQLQDGTVMVCGGTNQNGILDTVLIFNPAANAWTTLAEAMPSPLQSHTATMLTDGRVLVAGGDDGFGETASSFIYDPSKPDGSRWSTASALNNARFGHDATLLPNGTVMISGGVAQAGLGGGATANALQTIEFFHPAFNQWDNLTNFPAPRSFHTATLAPNGSVYFIGGANGSIGSSQSASFYKVYEAMYFTEVPDGNSQTQPSLRQSAITAATPSLVLPGGSFEVTGLRFRGATEASGGSAGPANTSFNSPRLLLQKIDGSGAGGAESSPGFIANLTAEVYANPLNQPTLDTDLKVTLPGNAALPYGWYMTWVGVTDIHSINAPLVQVGPPLPAGPVTSLVGTPAGVSAMTYSWTSPGGTFDGYNIYSATTGVFIATVSAATPSFTQTNLAPNTTASIFVAPYNISGDGLLAASATNYTLSTSPVNVSISSVTFDTLLLQWNPNGNTPGTIYEVSQSTDGFATSFSTPVPNILGVTATSYVIQNLGSDTTYYFRLRAFNSAGLPSTFSNYASTQTRSAVSGLTCGANGSGDTPTSIQWSWTPASANSYNVYNSSTGLKIGTVLGTNSTFYDTGLGVNSQRSIMVSAVTGSGEGPLSPAATCYTLAAVPLPGAPVMTSTSPTSVSLLWTNNGNPNGTVYDVNFESFVGTNVVVTTITTTVFGLNVGSLLPSTTYMAFVYAINGAGFASAPLLAGTTYTLANPQAALAVLGTTPTSIKVGWSQNSNSPNTYYQVTYSTDGFASNISTAVYFSSHLNLSSATISGLLTGTTYWVRVQAENPYGQMSGFGAPNSVSTITFNGGAAPGSLAGVLTALGISQFGGSLGDGTVFNMRSPGGAFPTDTTVTVSTYDTSGVGHGPLCPNGIVNVPGGQAMAFQITDNPAYQPDRPLYVTASYAPAEIAGPLAQISLSRYEPVSGTCVPLQTSFDPTTTAFTAEINHFSLYQLVQVPVATSADTARVFPNPYHARTDAYATIDQVPPSSRVRVMTLRGETVLDGTANGAGILTWSATNGSGRAVASGLYLVVVEAGGTKKILKLVVIR